MADRGLGPYFFFLAFSLERQRQGGRRFKTEQIFSVGISLMRAALSSKWKLNKFAVGVSFLSGRQRPTDILLSSHLQFPHKCERTCFVLEVVLREFQGTLFDQLKPTVVCLLYLKGDFLHSQEALFTMTCTQKLIALGWNNFFDMSVPGLDKALF